MSPRPGFVALCAAAWLAAAPAGAGSVSGTIALPPAPAPPRPVDLYGKYNEVERAPEAVATRPGVVALVASSARPLVTPAKPPVMDQKDLEFKPHVLPIQLGTTVRFTNSDPLFHNVFSMSAPKRFDLGRYSKGAAENVVFDKPGVVTVFCDIHAHMQAFIVVLDTPYFTITDGTGAYEIDGVPDGEYTVLFWHESFSDVVPIGSVSVRGENARFSGGVTGR